MERNSTIDAILLLNVAFDSGKNADFKPLTEAQYKRFAFWLLRQKLEPGALLGPSKNTILDNWARKISVIQNSRNRQELPRQIEDLRASHESRSGRIVYSIADTATKVTREQLEYLLGQYDKMEIVLDSWQNEEVWCLTRASEDYPKRLRIHLKDKSPPVLFGRGNVKILSNRSVAVVGSRNAEIEELRFSEQFGAQMANEGITIVSGGARGVDQTAMIGALKAGGQVVGIRPDDICRFRFPSSDKCNQIDEVNDQIEKGQLVLISPFPPKSRWVSWKAMARNKLIYTLSDTALVVESIEDDDDPKKSGTLAGGRENLTNVWVPLWVKHTDHPKSRNYSLVDQGGHWLPESDLSYQKLTSPEADDLSTRSEDLN